MEQALRQRGLDEQSADQLKVIPEEMEGRGRTPSAGESDEHVDEGHGHGKRSMLNKMKDKAKTLKTKVRKKMTPNHGGGHEENHSESPQNSQEATSEEEEVEEDEEEHHQAGDKTDSFGTRPVVWDDSKSSEQHIIAEKIPDISSNKEERGGVNAEAPGPSLGVGNIHQIQEQRQEEKPIGTTRFGESVPVKDIDDDGRGEFKSAEDNFQTGGFNSEATKSSLGLGKFHEIHEQGEEEKPLSTRSGETIPHTNVDDYARGDKSMEDNFQTTPKNEEPGKAWNQSSSEGLGKVNDNVKENPEKAELGKSWSERASEGLGFAKEKLQGYGVFSGVKSAEKPGEESHSSIGHVQDKDSEIGERKEMGSDIKSPTNTEEIKNGPSETGPGYVKEASMLAEEFKKVSSSSDKDKDTIIDGENKENEDEGTQKQQIAEGKDSPSYVGKIYSAKDAISSKLGFGGQNNQEPNVIGETKLDDQIQGKEMDIDEKSPSYTEESKTGSSETSSGYVKEASNLAEELKKVLSFDQTSSGDKTKDTLMEGENNQNGDEGIQQQLSGGEGKGSQSYASKIYSAKDAISSKLGYGGQTNHQEPNVIGESKPRTVTESMEENKKNEDEGKAGQGYVSKVYSAKDAISSKLGYGGQTNQEPNVIGESKGSTATERESMEMAKESKETLKSTIVSKLAPGEDEKALSEVITGAVSNSAKSLKDSIGGLYGGNGKVSTTDANMADSGINKQSSASNPSGGKGIMDRVTGVVGSLFGSKQVDNSEQHSASDKPELKSKVQIEEQVPEVPKY
jgi:hypothetical protein